MNYIDTGFCRSREFRVGQKDRILDIDELEPEGLCVAVYALNSRNRHERVAKVLSRVKTVQRLEMAVYVVDLEAHSILNKPLGEASAEYSDGFLRASDSTSLPSIKGLPPVVAGYLTPYLPDYVEQQLQSMLRSAA